MALIEAKTEAKNEEKKGAIAEPRTHALSVKNVLFATDFSPTSEAAMPYAAAICRRFGSTLHTAHVLSDTGLLMMTGGVDYVSLGTLYEDAHTEAKEKLDHMALCLEGIPHRCYVRHGQVWKSLAGIIEQSEIDLIVVGTHGRGGLGKLLLGSVAEDILRHAPCPVLTIGPKVAGHAKLPVFETRRRDLAPPDLDLRQVVCATNFAPVAVRVVQAAVALAEEFRSRLTLLHVIEEYTELGRRPGPIEDGVQHLRELIPASAALQYAPETVLDFGPAAECILKVAADREADMIILGARSSAEVGTTHLPWSTAHHVVANAPCPVLTIHG
jgi:nucleotide-binding universal stress UspA family protein